MFKASWNRPDLAAQSSRFAVRRYAIHILMYNIEAQGAEMQMLSAEQQQSSFPEGKAVIPGGGAFA